MTPPPSSTLFPYTTLFRSRPKVENEALFAAAGIVQSQCDVRIEADVQRLVDEAVQRGGGLHILVNNAGIGLVKQDRKSTRLNSSHSQISYAVFCLKKKKTK